MLFTTALWGMKRTGQRTNGVLEAALEGQLEDQQKFYSLPELMGCSIRDRSDVASSSLRKPDMLPSAEIDAALVWVVETNHGVPWDDAVVEASRLFGFRVTTAGLCDVFDRQVDRLLAAGTLKDRNGTLYDDS